MKSNEPANSQKKGMVSYVCQFADTVMDSDYE